MDRLPREYEQQIAKKRLPGLLGAIATAENRAVTLPEEKGRAEAVRARSLRAVVAQLLADLGGEEPPSPPTAPLRRRASAGAAQAPVTAVPPAPGPAPAPPPAAMPPAPGPAPTPPTTDPPPAEPDPAPAPAPPSPPADAAASALALTPATPLLQQTPVPQTTRTQEAGPQKLRRSTL